MKLNWFFFWRPLNSSETYWSVNVKKHNIDIWFENDRFEDSIERRNNDRCMESANVNSIITPFRWNGFFSLFAKMENIMRSKWGVFDSCETVIRLSFIFFNVFFVVVHSFTSQVTSLWFQFDQHKSWNANKNSNGNALLRPITVNSLTRYRYIANKLSLFLMSNIIGVSLNNTIILSLSLKKGAIIWSYLRLSSKISAR